MGGPEATGGALRSERREGERNAVRLPIKVTLLASLATERAPGSLRASSPQQAVAEEGAPGSFPPSARKDPSSRPPSPPEHATPSASLRTVPALDALPLSAEPMTLHALAVEVSERGMRLEIAGVPPRRLVDGSVRLEVLFAHDELRHLGVRRARAQWRRAGGERNAWLLGARFELAFAPEDLAEMIRCGRPHREKLRWWRDLLFVLVTSLVALGWYRSHGADVAEHEKTRRRLSTTEDDAVQARGALERCAAVTARAPAPTPTTPTTPTTPAPEPTPATAPPAVAAAPHALEDARLQPRLALAAEVAPATPMLAAAALEVGDVTDAGEHDAASDR